jgi:hypothetical protein
MRFVCVCVCVRMCAGYVNTFGQPLQNSLNTHTHTDGQYNAELNDLIYIYIYIVN